jgi:hypothetical protein
MTPTQLRQALSELNGERDLTVVFAEVPSPVPGLANLEVKRAMLIPDEADHLVKVTDGQSVYVLDAPRVAWVRIGLGKTVK